MTQDDVMREAELDEDEFEWLYDHTLDAIRRYGTQGVSVMLGYLDQELTEGREFIE